MVLRVERQASLLLVLLVISLAGVQASGVNKQVKKNKEDIEKLSQFIREDVIKPDHLKIEEKFDKLIDEINKGFEGLRTYVEHSVKQLADHTKDQMTKSDERDMKNIKMLEVKTKNMFESMNETMMNNLDKLSTTTETERQSIIDWAHQRAVLHENILKTKVAVCAHDHASFGPEAVVQYDSTSGGYIDNSYSIRMIDQDCGDSDDCAKTVLNKDTGVFTVPEKAGGVYMFTFTVLMDTWDTSLKPSAYKFRKNEKILEGTMIHSDVGYNHIHDIVPGSRTILLELDAGDRVDVFQDEATDLTNYKVSFCGALIYLEKVCSK